MRQLIPWCLVAAMCHGGCDGRSASQSTNTPRRATPAAQDRQKVVEEQERKYAEQLKRADGQLDVIDEEARRYAALMEKWEEQARRYDVLLSRWEEQIRRSDAILDRWERTLPQGGDGAQVPAAPGTLGTSDG